MSSTGALSSAAAALASSPRCRACLRAAVPVSASIRRTPAATALSPSAAMTPISPVRLTCVPPHNSTDQPMVLPPPSPMATTRTSSPYFSPNSARAPDAFDLLGRHRLGMGEVEAQPVGRDQRALLRHMIAEHLAQRLVQNMRRRMISPDGATAGTIDFQREGGADLERALLDRSGMDEHVARLLLGVGDGKAHALTAHGAGIADLPARLRIKRRLVEDDGAAL